MNRHELIKALQNQPDQRIWQIVRNHSDDYNFIFGSVANVPEKPAFDQSDEDYAQRCVEFVAQLQDTFYLEEAPFQPGPDVEKMLLVSLQSRNIELEATIKKINEAFEAVRGVSKGVDEA